MTHRPPEWQHTCKFSSHTFALCRYPHYTAMGNTIGTKHVNQHWTNLCERACMTSDFWDTVRHMTVFGLLVVWVEVERMLSADLLRFPSETKNDPMFTLQTPTMPPCWRNTDPSHHKDALPGEREKLVLCCLHACDGRGGGEIMLCFSLVPVVLSHNHVLSLSSPLCLCLTPSCVEDGSTQSCGCNGR